MPNTSFTPQTNGFAFVDPWTIDETESDQIRKMLTVASNNALILLNPIFGPSLVFIEVERALANWIADAVPQAMGSVEVWLSLHLIITGPI